MACGSKHINVDQSKYPGCVLNEHLDFTVISTVLGGIISKCLKLNSIVYNTYTKVYNTGVVPIMGYASYIWGYICYDKTQVVQTRAQRAFLECISTPPMWW